MSSKKDILGNCAICLKYGKLTFEHIPPKKAINSKPIYLQNSRHLIYENDVLFGKRIRSHKGSGLQTLCETCNNNLGAWYSKSYINFAKTSNEILKEHINPKKNSIPSEVCCIIEIEPLNIIKQIASMFLAISPGCSKIKSLRKLADFVQDKYSTEFPSELRIFMFFNITGNYKMLGYNFQMDLKTNQIVNSSELSFRPFGFKLTDGFAGSLDILEITDWSRLKLNQKVKMSIYCPVKNVDKNIFEPF